MRSVFVYEFLTGGGCWSLGGEPPSGSLLAEGQAMRDALASDFAAIADVEHVHLLHDVRLLQPMLPKQQLHEVRSAAEELRLLAELSARADATVLIAPEFSDLLLARVRLAEQAGARLISPGSELVKLVANKQQTAAHLAKHGIPVPWGMSFARELPVIEANFFPAVLKPNDGAGSWHVQLIDHAAQLSALDLTLADAWRLERFHIGIAVSVSFLAGPAGIVLLQPCAQHLSDDGRFTYHGGSTPLPTPLALRAQRLALAAALTLPQPRGYLGIDMVLGSAENGAEDVVIEINPRLTTSYLGLRQACDQNLAEAMWRVTRGQTISLTFNTSRIQFNASGPVIKKP